MAQTLSDNSLQAVFLDQIRNRLSDKVSFADVLAELLQVSRDSAYRRIRGETVLSLDEAKKLCERFGVSIDALLSPSVNTSLFHHRALSTNYTLERWLRSVRKNFEHINSFPDKEMIFAARDMPTIQNFRFPELCAFKMFFWLKTVIKDPGYAQQLFSQDAIPVDFVKAANKLWKLYATVPSTEIWSEEAINETLKQIEFYYDCNFFLEKDQSANLCDKLIELLSLIKREASEGQKVNGAEFRLYKNEILIANNTVLARRDNKRIVFINYNTLSLLTTFQESFCDKTEKYLSNLTKNSVLISTSAERERNKFFNNMKKRVTDFKNRLG
ncbi:MAG: helix-turn-helix transcriptional regulator [Cyclobacteriaceae bacterium]|nr:helix-turn-helix transcriptional regulator [Cyclobacteriaceae bacterium]